MKINRFILLAMSFLLVVQTGCANRWPDAQTRIQYVERLTEQAQWHGQLLKISTPQHPQLILQSYGPPKSVQAGQPLVVFIEGDGFAWVNRSTPSKDPTPIRPVALEMALEHPHSNVVYLSRPCQYVRSMNANCPQGLWTQQRFSSGVVEIMDAALDQLKQQRQAQELVLVGFSGGAALAVLLADRRVDVVGLITVAGNLDTKAWAQWHKITPLSQSINPVDVAPRMRHLRQLHVVGGRDQEIAPDLARSWWPHYANDASVEPWVLPDADHLCCWADAWEKIWAQYTMLGSK